MDKDLRAILKLKLRVLNTRCLSFCQTEPRLFYKLEIQTWIIYMHFWTRRHLLHSTVTISKVTDRNFNLGHYRRTKSLINLRQLEAALDACELGLESETGSPNPTLDPGKFPAYQPVPIGNQPATPASKIQIKSNTNGKVVGNLGNQNGVSPNSSSATLAPLRTLRFSIVYCLNQPKHRPARIAGVSFSDPPLNSKNGSFGVLQISAKQMRMVSSRGCEEHLMMAQMLRSSSSSNGYRDDMRIVVIFFKIRWIFVSRFSMLSLATY